MDPFDFSSRAPDLAPPSKAVDPYDHSMQPAIDDQLTIITYNQAIFPVIILSIAGGLIGTVVWPVVPQEYFAAWFLLFFSALLVRFLVLRQFSLRGQSDAGLNIWRTKYVLVAAFNGLIWGSLVLFNFLIESEMLRMVLILTALGIATGGMNSYAPIRNAYLAFLSTVLIPVSIWTFNQAAEPYILTGLLFLFGISLLRSGVRHRRILEEGVRLGMANTRLVEELSDSNQNLVKEKATQEVLHQLAELGLRNDSLDTLMSMALEITCRMPWLNVKNKGAIFLVEKDTTRLRLSAPWNIKPDQLSHCANMKTGECLCGRARLYNKLIFSDDYPQDDAVCEHLTGLTRYMMPISSGDKVLGLLTLYLEQGHQKTEEEVIFLKMVASSLANIIERIRAIESSQLALRVFDNTNDAILLTNPDGVIINVNPAFSHITGFDRMDVIGHKPNLLRSGHHSDDFYTTLWTELKANGDWIGEITNRRKNGSLITVQQNISSIRDASGETVNYVGVFHDITHLKRAQEDMRQLAYFDALTGLPNRHMFEDRLQHAVSVHQQIDQRLAVLFIDIRGFRTMNQSFGYSAGDDVLRATVHRLKTVVRSADTLSRIGGDEFAVLMNQVDDPKVVEAVVDRINQAMSNPFKIEGVEVHGRVHIGISLYPDDASESRGLIDCADTALHQATSELQDTGGHRYYSGEQKEQSVSRLRLESDLRHAVENKELVLFYQPQFNLKDGALVGAEALLRWKRGGEQLVPPNDFIPLAEHSGLIVPITEWIIPQVLTDWYPSNEVQPVLPRVAINLSGHHIGQPERLIKFITETLSRSGLAPQHLELEVTESSILEDIGRATETLKAISDLGVTIALDDFGTGYSSLSYLVSLPIDILKIDRMFITDICTNERSLDIVRGLIMMCHSIGINVVAEGIETLEQGELLAEIGCDIVQGFYYGRPVPMDEFHWNNASH